MNLVECIPNISEARNKTVLNKIIGQLSKNPYIKLLHIDSGYDTNRTVISFVCKLSDLKEASVFFTKVVFESLDMRQHSGTHPRIGAIDVFPFVPLGSTSIEELNIKVKDIASTISQLFQIPVYLYAKSSTRLETQSLSSIRKGEYEKVLEKISTIHPDFYPTPLNKINILKYGILTMGVRDIMVAYNINLNTTNVNIAKDIAGKIRETGINGKKGLFKDLKSIGWYIEEYSCVQVSCNVMNYKTAPLHKIYEKVKELAEHYNTSINGSEIVGLVPKQALIDTANYYSSSILNEVEAIKLAIKKLGLNSVKKFIPQKQILEYLLDEVVKEL